MNLDIKTYIFLNTFVISGLILYFNSVNSNRLFTAWLVVIALIIIMIDNFTINVKLAKKGDKK